ncbi:hypothetical protein D3C75_1124220 [compost metagenome]
MASMAAKTVPTPGITAPAVCTAFQPMASLVSLRSHLSSFSLPASMSFFDVVLSGAVADWGGRAVAAVTVFSPRACVAIRASRRFSRVTEVAGRQARSQRLALARSFSAGRWQGSLALVWWR